MQSSGTFNVMWEMKSSYTFMVIKLEEAIWKKCRWHDNIAMNTKKITKWSEF
jgi:hypothetical protein